MRVSSNTENDPWVLQLVEQLSEKQHFCYFGLLEACQLWQCMSVMSDSIQRAHWLCACSIENIFKQWLFHLWFMGRCLFGHLTMVYTNRLVLPLHVDFIGQNLFMRPLFRGILPLVPVELLLPYSICFFFKFLPFSFNSQASTCSFIFRLSSWLIWLFFYVLYPSIHNAGLFSLHTP